MFNRCLSIGGDMNAVVRFLKDGPADHLSDMPGPVLVLDSVPWAFAYRATPVSWPFFHSYSSLLRFFLDLQLLKPKRGQNKLDLSGLRHAETSGMEIWWILTPTATPWNMMPLDWTTCYSGTFWNGEALNRGGPSGYLDWNSVRVSSIDYWYCFFM